MKANIDPPPVLQPRIAKSEHTEDVGAALGAAMNVAAALAQRRPLRAFAALVDARRIGYRQFAEAYAVADEDTRLLAVKLTDALRAL